MQHRRILLWSFSPRSESKAALRQMMANSGRWSLEFVEMESPSGAAGRIAWPEKVRRFEPDLVLLFLPADTSNHAIPETVEKGTRVVAVVEETSDADSMMGLLERGVTDFLLSPLRAAEVLPRLGRLLEFATADEATVLDIKERLGLRQFIGQSPVFVREIRKIPRLAGCDASVLISGETGTGKEICARAVHYLSSRAGKPFIPVNCGAIPLDLLENELFGHESEAFTGARSSREGLIHEADGGTLFLDEIDALPPSAQVKLLRFLQEKEYRPLGSRKVCKADVRVIAASNIDFRAALKESRFRQDLFFRLSVLVMSLPPLRQRVGDIPLLAAHFLAKYAAMHHPVHSLDLGVIRKLQRHDWPGNVRELENIIERAMLLCEGSTIGEADIQLPDVDEESGPRSFRQRKTRVIEDFERGYMQELLTRHRGNITRAALEAQKNRRAFFELVRKYRLRPRDFSSPRV